MLNRLSRAIGWGLLLLLCLSPAATAGPVALTILHTNDTHGHLLPFSYPETAEPGSELAGLKTRRDIGGIARRAALARQIRSELGRKDVTVWLVDAGDFSDGTPFSTEYHGEADIAAMNACGYDFATLGNHELNYPLDQVRKLLSLARYPVVCANLTIRDTGQPFVPPYLIRSIGPLKIAVFGLVTTEARAYPATRQGLAIADETICAGRMAAALKHKADIIIAISHCGEKMDRHIAEAVPDIAVIIGGHSHSRLPSGEFVWHSEALKADDVNGTIIVQNHQWGGELGRLDLLFVQDTRGKWHVSRYHARLIPVTAHIAADEAVAAVVTRFWQPLAERYGEIVGRAAADFISTRDDLAEYNLVADAIRDTFSTDFVLENIGGVRAPLVKGPITKADLVAMDPFGNTIVTFQVSGAKLRKLLLKHRPAVSGLRYRIQAGGLMEASCGGRPIADNIIYTGAVNSYVARTWLKGTAVRETGRKRLDVLADYIRRQGEISPVHDKRREVMIP